MKFKIEELDGRHTGQFWFRYRLLIGSDGFRLGVSNGVPGTTQLGNIVMTDPSVRFVNFSEARNFCWQTYGPSTEIEIYETVKNLSENQMYNPHWAWLLGYRGVTGIEPLAKGKTKWNTTIEQGYIYLYDDPELEFFTLRFGNT
jgi:hypothetical protein